LREDMARQGVRLGEEIRASQKGAT